MVTSRRLEISAQNSATRSSVQGVSGLRERLEISCPLLEQVKLNPAQYMIQHNPTGPLCRPEHLMVALHERLCKDGVEMLGIAPPGDLERKIQAYLDEMK